MLNLPAILKQAEALPDESFAVKAQVARDCEEIAPKNRVQFWRGLAEAYGEAAALDELVRTTVPQLVAALQEAQGKLGAIEEAALLGPDVPASEILSILKEEK